MFLHLKKEFIWLLAVCLFVICLQSCSIPEPVQCNISDLILHINDANATPNTQDTLNLAQGCHYLFSHVNNMNEGANGLPIITSPIVINGNDAIISRSTTAQDKFRLFYIAGSGNLTINHLILTGGYAFDPNNLESDISNSGGAIFNHGQLSINKSIIKKNYAFNVGEGAGIMNFGILEIADSTLSSNEDGLNTIMGGAALFNFWNANATLINSTINHNGILAFQDAIWTAGTLSMTNCTISGNGKGGIDNEGDLYLNFMTFADNGGFAINGVSGNVTMRNTLFGPNGWGACSPSLPLSNPSQSNMDTDGSCNGTTVSVSELNIAPLGNFGGLTMTHALMAGSAAIDQIESGALFTQSIYRCMPTDQRGVSRPYGAACDIGAYEYTGDVFPDAMLAPSITSENIATPTFTLTNTSSAHSCTFTAIKNLFCRSGPGSSIYPALDSLSVGEFADVVGQSADGQFVYLVAPHTSGFCVVPTGSNFGTLAGDACSSLAVFTPPPPPTSTPTFVNLPDSNPSQPGCTVMKLSSGIPECVVPCPEGAIPGKPCTP